MKHRLQTESANFTPVSNTFLVKADEFPTEKTTKSGLIVPINEPPSNSRPCTGTIVSVGKHLESDVVYKANEKIAWASTDGLDLEFDDGDFLLIRLKSIIGKIK